MNAKEAPQSSPHKKQNKDNHFGKQLKAVYESLFNEPKTMLMADKDTGVNRANICRYIDTLKKSELVYLVKKDKCKISHYTAGYYTTNPKYFKNSNQLKLF